MKPKTKIQKEVARLSANLRPISATQIDWAYRHCVEHIGYRTKKGNITCSDCGHEWHSDSGLCDTLEGCTCPKCHAELKVQDTRRRIGNVGALNHTKAKKPGQIIAVCGCMDRASNSRCQPFRDI